MFEKYKCSTNKKKSNSIIDKYNLLYFYVNCQCIICENDN